MNFDEVFEKVLTFETRPGKVYVNDPLDPGGETKYGISKRAYPNLDIASLTLEEAKEIYRTDYWVRSGANRIDSSLGYPVFDAAVNHGVRGAVKMLQRACGAKDDGIIGPKTIAMIQKKGTPAVFRDFMVERLTHFARIAASNPSSFDHHRVGWFRRALHIYEDFLTKA